MLTSQTESRGGEKLCAASVFFPLLRCCFWRLCLPKLRGSEDPVASGNAECNAKPKTRTKTKNNDDDFASSNANVQCSCDVWAAKTIAKLVKLFFFFFSLDVAASAQRCVFWAAHNTRGVLQRSRRSRAFTHSTASEEPQKKKKAATRAGRVAQGLTLRPRRSMDGRCARLASGPERDSRDAVNGHGGLFRCSLDGRI